MNLIEIYIQEVTRRLPEKSREDIALELRSTIEDMLPDDYSEKDIKSALEQLGSPVALASNYSERPMHLIGPRYFDVYLSLLKMILPIGAVIAIIAISAENVFQYKETNEALLQVILSIIGHGIWTMIEVGIQVFFWLTIVFAILERMDKRKDHGPLTASLEKWTSDDLQNISYIPKKRAISRLEVFGSLLWTAIWATLYFNADKLVGIYTNKGNGLEFVTPVFNQEVLQSYWLIILIVIGLEIILNIFKVLKGQWTRSLAIFNTCTQLITTVIFVILLCNPNLFAAEFLNSMADIFNINPTTNPLQIWLTSGGIAIFLLSAAIDIYSGIRKASTK